MRPPAEFIALHVILGDTGARAYNAGDDVPASAVENLGLVPGVDVRPVANFAPRPGDDAKRYQWARYLLGKQVPVDEIDEMTREQMVAKADELEAAERKPVETQVSTEHREPPAPNAPKKDHVDYAVWRGMDLQTAKDSTAAQLADCDYDTLFGPRG